MMHKKAGLATLHVAHTHTHTQKKSKEQRALLAVVVDNRPEPLLTNKKRRVVLKLVVVYI